MNKEPEFHTVRTFDARMEIRAEVSFRGVPLYIGRVIRETIVKNKEYYISPLFLCGNRTTIILTTDWLPATRVKFLCTNSKRNCDNCQWKFRCWTTKGVDIPEANRPLQNTVFDRIIKGVIWKF